jgi:hypothetical protein
MDRRQHGSPAALPQLAGLATHTPHGARLLPLSTDVHGVVPAAQSQ